jgi:hypothetical protein
VGDREDRDVSGSGRDELEREIDELLQGRGSSGSASGSGAPGGGAPGGESGRPQVPGSARSEGGGLEDLLGGPGASGSAGRQRHRDAREQPGSGSFPVNFSALIGLLIAIIVIFVFVNALRNTESGTVGIGSAGIGEKVEPFAVPLAMSDLEGDANVEPAQACQVAGDDVMRICDYFDRPLLISFWFTGGAAECIDQQDVFDQVATRFRKRVGAVSINVRDDRGRVRDLIEERGWKVPVGHDTDGAVSNVYRVGGCPTFLFVKPGGVLERAEIGRTTVEELSSQVRSFLDGQEETQKAGQKTPGS